MPVNTEHKAYARAKAWWKRCRDVAEGGDAVKEAGVEYLPILSGQTANEYSAYKARAFFYNATSRTLAGLVGAICRKDPDVDGVPKAIDEHMKDLTLDGVGMPAFALRALDEVLTVGRGGIFVDMPAPEEGTTSAKKRPYWVLFTAEQIVSWQTTQVNGETILTRVVLFEKVETIDEKDAFALKEQKQYRVLELVDGAYQVTIHTPKPGNETEFVAGTTFTPRRSAQPLARIPFEFIGPFGNRPQVYRPPVLDLVDANLSHYRTSADYEHGSHFCGIPTPYTTGWEAAPENLPLGPSKVWHISNPQGSAGMLEFTGQGLGALEKNLERKERLMAVLGARLLETPKVGVEAADTVRMRHSGEQATLKTVAASVGQSITNALKKHVWWAGYDESVVAKVLVTLNTDFFVLSLTPDEVRAAMQLWQADGMSFETFFWKLAQGGWMRPGMTPEQEKKDIEAGGGNGGGDPLPDPEPEPEPEA